MSSPSADFERVIYELLFQNVGVLYPGTQIYVPNRKWKQPDNAFYYAFYILPGTPFNCNIGSVKVERTAVVLHLSCYCPTEIADRTSIEMAETGARVFAQRDIAIGPGHRAIFGPPAITSGADPKSNKHRTIAKVVGHRDCRVYPRPAISCSARREVNRCVRMVDI